MKGGTVLRVFEDRLLRRIFGLKRNEVAGRLRKLYNGEHHHFVFFTEYSYNDQVDEVSKEELVYDGKARRKDATINMKK
jgi:hypothetical protein